MRSTVPSGLTFSKRVPILSQSSRLKGIRAEDTRLPSSATGSEAWVPCAAADAVGGGSVTRVELGGPDEIERCVFGRDPPIEKLATAAGQGDGVPERRGRWTGVDVDSSAKVVVGTKGLDLSEHAHTLPAPEASAGQESCRRIISGAGASRG